MIDIECADGIAAPPATDIERWVRAALAGRDDAEVSLRLVDEAEGAALNHTWRGREGATNVLAFRAELPPGTGSDLLGDVVVCAPLADREAAAQHKTREAHWAHLVVHGVLHLLGHDHLEDGEAAEMESQEVDILAALGYPNPYRAVTAAENGGGNSPT